MSTELQKALDQNIDAAFANRMEELIRPLHDGGDQPRTAMNAFVAITKDGVKVTYMATHGTILEQAAGHGATPEEAIADLQKELVEHRAAIAKLFREASRHGFVMVKAT